MEIRIKERLVGAIALVAIVVVVVPELLTGPRPTATTAPAPGPTPTHTVVIDLTASERGAIGRPPAGASAAPAGSEAPAGPPPAPPAEVAAAPAAESAAAGVAGAPAAPSDAKPAGAAKPSARPPPVAQAPPATAAQLAPAAPAPPAAAPAPRPALPAAGAEGWVVQLGSFASRENADALAKGLRAKGYRAFVSEFRGSGRVLFRVRVGPEQDHARAESIAARLASEGHHGSIVPQP